MASIAFVGREKELSRLLECFAKTDQNQFGLIFIRGAAGSGKTSLITQFRELITQQYPETLVGSGFCNAQTGMGDPYMPFRCILNELMESSEDKKRKKDKRSEDTLKKLFAVSAKCIVDVAPDLIGTFVPGGVILQGIGKFLLQETQISEKINQAIKVDSQKQELGESKIQEQYASLLGELSKIYRLVLIIDDVHWADEASISLLYHLAQSLKKQRVMMICLFREADVMIGREGKRHPVERISYELQRVFGDVWIDLDRISTEERRRFTDQMIDREPNKLGRQFRESIYEITNGNALFTQELLCHLEEIGSLIQDENRLWIENGRIDWSVIPPRVEGIVRERINRLEDFLKEILSIASVQGKSFLVQAVSSILKIPERDLVRKLSEVLDKQHRLVREDKVQRLGSKALFYFGFTDTLIHNYIYNELSMSERMLFSNDVAEILETQYGENASQVAVDLAHLYQVAGNEEKAVEYSILAGKNAFRLSAYAQAIQYFRDALHSLEQLPWDEKAKHFKLEILKSLSLSLKPTEGWNGPEVLACARQAVDLGYEMKEFKSISPMMYSLWSAYVMDLELEQAKIYALKYLELGKQLAEPEILLQATLALANTTFWQGKLDETNGYLEDFFKLYDPLRDAGQIEHYGQDPRIMGLLFSCMVELMRGDIDNADAIINDMLGIAAQITHPFSKAIAMQAVIFRAYYYVDFDALEKNADDMIELSEKFGFVFYLGYGRMFKGICLAKRGQFEESLALIETGYHKDILRDGGKLLNAFYGFLKAQAELWSGNAAHALQTIEKALQISLACGEMSFYSELLRIKAHALLTTGDHAAARAILTEAINQAQISKMVVSELKALLDLAELEPGDSLIKARIEECLGRLASRQLYENIQRTSQYLGQDGMK